MVRKCALSEWGLDHPVNIVVVPRHPLASLAKDALRLEQPARPVQNDDLVLHPTTPALSATRKVPPLGDLCAGNGTLAGVKW